ncbi:MAG: uracil-DNA glycosylase family protein [Halioglobus sp.]
MKQTKNKAEALDGLLTQIRQCDLCQEILPLGPRPVVQAASGAKILIAGQAPGARVHETGVPFDDPSGKRLREWLGVDSEQFYDSSQFAIIPMAFCYPGRGRSGDLPPPPLCAQTWRQALLERLPNLKLTLVIGQYAQAWHLPQPGRTLTETVKDWSNFDPSIMPLPHPSPRNNFWLRRNPWFETDLLPQLKERVTNALT